MKLVYFNGRGLAETSRLILALVKEEYEDYRYPLEVIDWKTHNMKKDEFNKDKADGKLKSSLNKVPYLDVDGGVIAQSKAIERYLAWRFSLMGDNDIESAQIDSICEVVRDIKDMYQKVRKLPDTEKELGMNTRFSETLPNKLKDLEYIIEGKHSIGERLSLADIVLFSLITQFFDDKNLAMGATVNTPKIRAIVELVASNNEIKSWLETRPVTAF